MKTVGIVGGIAPESTIEYYRLLVAEYRRRRADESYPPILINSIDLTRMIGLIAAGEMEAVTAYLGKEIARLARAGADFAVLASNTPHIVFDELRRRAPVPMISIVAAAADAARALGLRRVGLFGTRFTMQGPFYPAVFAAAGMAVVAPTPEEQAWIHDKYMGELVDGIIRAQTRERLLEIAERQRARDGVEAIVLGGTELPLILREAAGPVRFLDTTAIHVARIVEEMLA